VRIWCEFLAVSLIKLILEFDPVQTQCMQEALQCIHHHQHADGHSHEGQEAQRNGDEVNGQRRLEGLVEKCHCQLRVRQRQSPQSQIRRSVRHTP